MKVERTIDRPHGLALLIQAGTPQHFTRVQDFKNRESRRTRHPLGLSAPKDAEILFVGVNDSARTVEAFIAHIRDAIGGETEEKITCLRIAMMPAGNPGENWTFFEFWVGSKVVVSGDTCNFTPAGKQALYDLSCVFSVLARTFNIEMEIITITDRIPMSEICNPEDTQVHEMAHS